MLGAKAEVLTSDRAGAPLPAVALFVARDRLRVHLVSVDIDQGFIDFVRV
jgi:hypothetical protein